MQAEHAILQRLDTISHQLDEITRRQSATEELVEEVTPIAREAIATAIARLDALDKQGYFAFLAELGQVGRKVVEGFSPADVRQLGDAIVGILDVVRALTRPEVLQIATDAAAALRDADQAKPLGAFRALRATRDDDVQKGLGLFIDLVRRIGHGVNAAAAPDGKALDQRAKLAELLGPRRATRMLPAPSPARPAASAAAKSAAPAEPRAIDPSSWTRELGTAIAAEQGIALDGPRWKLIDAARAEFAATQASPNIQRLKSIAGVTTQDLYQLFPKAPARTIAKIAGLPKPAGCL
ncbi:MAG TPA: TusE/DsrC/DsvC family sulfur relay protein [Kofleriaceae bacterium]